MLVTVTFFILLAVYIFSSKRRVMFFRKKAREWVLDLTGLSIQGTIIPLLQTLVLAVILREFFPRYAATVDIHWVFAFLLNFVVVDYIYYWNHRLLHSNALWPFHRVHHSVSQFDVLATSRNSIWSSFLIVYVWINSFAIYLLADPAPYVVALSLTAALDLWRHSEIESKGRWFEKFLSRYLFLVTPADHATHHDKRAKFNYGANLNLFDKIHGTYEFPKEKIWNQLGIETKLSLTRELFYPFDAKK